jgi:hypothetical protein
MIVARLRFRGKKRAEAAQFAAAASEGAADLAGKGKATSRDSATGPAKTVRSSMSQRGQLNFASSGI